MDKLSPDLREEFEARYRQERMLENLLQNNYECSFCKLVSGSLFLVGATLFGVRTRLTWPFFGSKEKLFNLSAVGLLYMISFLNLRAAWQIHNGKNMVLIETRPSLSQRLMGAYHIIGGRERKQHLETMMKYEEEKADI